MLRHRTESFPYLQSQDRVLTAGDSCFALMPEHMFTIKDLSGYMHIHLHSGLRDSIEWSPYLCRHVMLKHLTGCSPDVLILFSRRLLGPSIRQ